MRARLHILALVCAVALTCGAMWGSPCATDAQAEVELAVIAHPSLSSDDLSPAELKLIFSRDREFDRDGKRLVPFNFATGTPLRASFDRAVMSLNPQQSAKFWIDQRIRGKAGPPREVPSVAVMGQVVSRLPKALGYVPANQVPAKVRVVARIIDGEVVDP